MAALGLGDGLHSIGQLKVTVKNRRAFLSGTETLAGSIAPMDDCIRRFMKAAQVGLVEGETKSENLRGFNAKSSKLLKRNSLSELQRNFKSKLIG